jgi:hypothetical protein
MKLFKPLSLNQRGMAHYILLGLIFVLLFGSIGYYVIKESRAATPTTANIAAVIPSGFSKKCLDDWHRGASVGNKVDLYTCNGTVAQKWGVYSDNTIRMNGYCMATSANAKTSGTKVVLANCSKSTTDTWTHKANGNLYNDVADKCLTATSNTKGLALVIKPCTADLSLNQQWHAPAAPAAPKPPTPTPTPTPPSGTSMHIITSLYAYPTLASWTQVESAAPTVKYAIVNICAPDGTGSGCGSPANEANPAWVPTIKALKAAGITPLYYISTNYGAVSLATAESELKNAVTWYGIADPMFDTTAPGNTAYYQALYNYAVNTLGAGTVVFNPGTAFATDSYMFDGTTGTKEIIQVFEGTAAGFEGTSFPSWMKNYPASDFAATMSAGTTGTIGTDANDATKDHIGNIYEDDEAEPPNYSTLPAFWTTEVNDVAKQ